MPEPDRPLVCPECGAKNKPGARTCRDCGEALTSSAVTGRRPRPRADEDDEEDDRPRRRPRRDAGDDQDLERIARRVTKPTDDPGAASLLVPIGVSGWAVAAGYLGLLSCIPCLGGPFGLLAIGCGVMALMKGRNAGTFGKASGVMRAVVGITCGVIGVLISAVALLGMILGASGKR